MKISRILTSSLESNLILDKFNSNEKKELNSDIEKLFVLFESDITNHRIENGDINFRTVSTNRFFKFSILFNSSMIHISKVMEFNTEREYFDDIKKNKTNE